MTKYENVTYSQMIKLADEFISKMNEIKDKIKLFRSYSNISKYRILVIEIERAVENIKSNIGVFTRDDMKESFYNIDFSEWANNVFARLESFQDSYTRYAINAG